MKTITHPHSHTRGRVLLIHLNSHTREEYYSFIQTHIQDKGSVLLTHPQGNRITHSPKLTYKIWEEHYSLTHTNTQYEGVLLTHPHKGRVLLAHPHSHNIKEEYYSSTWGQSITPPHQHTIWRLLIHPHKGRVLLTHPHSHTRQGKSVKERRWAGVRHIHSTQKTLLFLFFFIFLIWKGMNFSCRLICHITVPILPSLCLVPCLQTLPATRTSHTHTQNSNSDSLTINPSTFMMCF